MRASKNIRKRILYSFGLSAFWIVILILKGNPSLTLRKDLNDLTSNVTNGILFSDVGYRFYTSPTSSFLNKDQSNITKEFQDKYGLQSDEVFVYPRSGRPVAAVWSFVPRPYPPGAYLIFTPISFLYHYSPLAVEQVNLIAIFIFLIVGHLVIFEIINLLKRRNAFQLSKGIQFLSILLLIFCYFEVLRVSMIGAYDVLAIAFILLSLLALAEKRDFGKALLFLSLALFFHIRSLYYAPIFFWIVYEAGSDGIKRLTRSSFFWISGAILWAFLFFLWQLHDSLSEQYPVTNSLFWMNFTEHRSPFIIWGILTAVVLGISISAKNYLFVLIILWMDFMLLMSPYLKSWYSLFLVPAVIIGIFYGKVGRSLLAAFIYFTITASYFFNNSPFEFQFLRDLLN